MGGSGSSFALGTDTLSGLRAQLFERHAAEAASAKSLVGDLFHKVRGSDGLGEHSSLLTREGLHALKSRFEDLVDLRFDDADSIFS